MTSVSLVGAEGRAVLVLDAVDRLRNPTIFDQLGRLLERDGERLRLIMTTRADPPMPLHRYRLEGTLAEIRHDEIAFNRNEIESLFKLHSLALPDESVEEVVERTEGWAAGVRLAALTLQSGGDHARLHWLTAEYLTAEVLSDLTSADRDFLVRVSLFDEIPAGMASEITGRADADLLLRRMSLRNTFVQPVRGRLGYYRMHPLMRAVLARELPRDQPAAGVDPRSRAADWFNTQGQVGTAVEHAAASGDWLRAARFVVRSLAIGDLLVSTYNRFAADRSAVENARPRLSRCPPRPGRIGRPEGRTRIGSGRSWPMPELRLVERRLAHLRRSTADLAECCVGKRH